MSRIFVSHACLSGTLPTSPHPISHIYALNFHVLHNLTTCHSPLTSSSNSSESPPRPKPQPHPYPVSNESASDDIRDVDLTKVHNLSGPVAVEGAEPGDCLVVDILDGASPPPLFLVLFVTWGAILIMGMVVVTPFDKMPWGYTVRPPPSSSPHQCKDKE